MAKITGIRCTWGQILAPRPQWTSLGVTGPGVCRESRSRKTNKRDNNPPILYIYKINGKHFLHVDIYIYIIYIYDIRYFQNWNHQEIKIDVDLIKFIQGTQFSCLTSCSPIFWPSPGSAIVPKSGFGLCALESPIDSDIPSMDLDEKQGTKQIIHTIMHFFGNRFILFICQQRCQFPKPSCGFKLHPPNIPMYLHYVL